MWRCCFPRKVENAEVADNTTAGEGSMAPPHSEAPDASARPGRAGVEMLRSWPLSASAQLATADELQRRQRRSTSNGWTTPRLLSDASSGPDSVFSSSGSESRSRRGPVPHRPDVVHLDLSAMTQGAVVALSQQQIQAMGRDCTRLTLPRGCTADTVRSWLKACIALEDITALDILEDHRPLLASQARHLKYFRTLPPGPGSLHLGLDTRAVVPMERPTSPDLRLLRRWVAQPATLPDLDGETFAQMTRSLDPYLFGSVAQYRKGLTLTPGLQRSATTLMRAVPGALLPRVDAANHAHVMQSLQERPGRPMEYAELLNFIRPTLRACWDILACPRKPSGHEPRSKAELQALAALRHWVLSAPPQESMGQRERVAAAARRSDNWNDPAWRSQFITAALQGGPWPLEGDPAVTPSP